MQWKAGTDDSGFTLVELLVVIGIIAVLAGLLLSAIGTTKGKVLRVVCASNLRQIAIAIHLYAADNDDSLPGPLLTGIQAGYNLGTGGESPFPRLGNFLWSGLGQPNPDRLGTNI